MLRQAKAENARLGGYVERFGEADKRAAVLEQQFEGERKTSRAVEIIVIVGTTIGGAIFGVAFYFFGKTPPDTTSGVIALAVGVVMVGGAIAAKIAQR